MDKPKLLTEYDYKKNLQYCSCCNQLVEINHMTTGGQTPKEVKEIVCESCQAKKIKSIANAQLIKG